MTSDRIAAHNGLLTQISREVVFAGDKVRLSGQIDYPPVPVPHDGFPLLFVLHHAGSESREWYDQFAQIGLNCGFAVFRWDKRGTGRSGASGLGSSTQDAVNAYEIALEQPRVNQQRTIILAQGAGTSLLGSAYGLFARLQSPHAVILASNMLDEKAVLAIDTRVHILMSTKDWHPWQQYARTACEAHRDAYKHGASYSVVTGADRKLMVKSDSEECLHSDAEAVLTDWLKHLCQTSRSI